MKKLVVFLLCLVLLTIYTAVSWVDSRQQQQQQQQQQQLWPCVDRAGLIQLPLAGEGERASRAACWGHVLPGSPGTEEDEWALCYLLPPNIHAWMPTLSSRRAFAKQLLRSKRQERPMKAGHPDEPMREHLLHMQVLDQRAQETNLEHWLNPHCYPRCDRNYGHPV
ncbi:uncharacterized protein C17orf67 homolog [Sander vitreus]